jgi:hypothetical protein
MYTNNYPYMNENYTLQRSMTVPFKYTVQGHAHKVPTTQPFFLIPKLTVLERYVLVDRLCQIRLHRPMRCLYAQYAEVRKMNLSKHITEGQFKLI